MIETIEKLVRIAPTFTVTDNGGAIHDYFEHHKEAEGVVIVDEEKPVGVLMRNNFYQKIGRQFGYSLYMKRDVTLLMKSDITCVDISCDMARFGFIAMNRNQDNIYDFIVVLDNERYAGTVSISEFLIEMSRTKEREISLLNDQQRMLKQANEAEIHHRMEIEQKNAAIKNLLDHAGQGFLFFDSDLIISEEYSKECDEIFGFYVGNQNFLEVIRRYVEQDCIQLMQDTFYHVFQESNQTRNKVYLSILPGEINMGKRYIKCEYKVIPNETGKSVMMILTDITEKKALELKNAEEKNNIKLIIRAISSKSEIDQAIEELHEFIEGGVFRLLDSCEDIKTSLQHIFRMVHTMKGDFALNSLHHTSAELHRLEDALSLMLKNCETVDREVLRDFIEQIDCGSLLEKDLSVITEALGQQFLEKDDTYTVSKQRIIEIQKQIRTVFQGEEQAVVSRMMESLFFTNIKDIIKDYNDYIKTLAEKFGKNIDDIKITGENVYIDRERYLPFLKTLVHVFRNMADHGIEDPEARACQGKQEYGKISCTLETIKGRFVLCLADDGKGIDAELVRKKAVEKGIYSEDQIARLSRDQILETIFFDDFSTKETVDLYSGRGVGLAAVWSETKKIGGEVKLDTESGRYTRFRFTIPLDS